MLKHTGLLLYLILSLPFWSACSGAENTPETSGNLIATVTPLPLNTTISPEAGAIIPDLSEIYTGENALVNASLTVRYPSGWTVSGSGTVLQLASENPDTITANSDALIISVMPVGGELLANPANISATALVEQALSDTTGQIVTASATTLTGHDAAFATTTFESNTVMVYAIQFDTDVFILLTAIRSEEFTPEDELLVRAIAEMIDYIPGGIPQSDE